MTMQGAKNIAKVLLSP